MNMYNVWATKIRQHALDHYGESGWDYLVECWDNEDLTGIFSFHKCTTYESAFRHVRDAVEWHDERRREVEATAW